MKKNLPEVEKENEVLKNLDKNMKFIIKSFRRFVILEYVVFTLLAVAIIIGFIGLRFYPKEAPDARAVSLMYGSALVIGVIGIIVSVLSIMYGTLGMKLSLFLFSYQETINKKDKLGRVRGGSKSSDK